MTASNTASTFSTSFNPQNINFLQQQAQQQSQSIQIQQNILNSAQFNAVSSNVIQQQGQGVQVQGQQGQQIIPQQSQQQPKDTTFTKIFVGGLPYHTTDESLSQFFQKFGNIEEAVVINDRQTGKSRGYGFVTMETKESAESAVLDPNPVIDGRKSNVNLAYLGVKSRIVAAPPTGIIPLAVRYQLPAQSSPYGFHPLYYHHPAENTVQSAHPTAHPQYITTNTPNQLLIPAQQQQSNNMIQASNSNCQSAGLFDLTQYNTQHVAAALNSNRTSPFDNGMNTFTHPSVNALINQQTQQVSNSGYFAPIHTQHLNSVFQSQLHERL